jgi:hypothetical protein
MAEERVLRRSWIADEFEGFDDEMLFRLDDGSCWLQDEYRYWYHYAYRPEALIVLRGGRFHIEVAGQSVPVRETQIHAAGTIDGAFRGWDGKSRYKLNNGQVWEQSAYHYEYKYSYGPEAFVYEASSGTVMAVDGTHANVRRVK